MARDRILKLVAIATAAGAFSGLFGVGGGTIIVPLLILWLGYGEREATGTSLAAIVDHRRLRGASGRRSTGTSTWPRARWSAVPALAGVVAGTALQQRIPERAVALLFAALLDRDRHRPDRLLMEYVAAALLGIRRRHARRAGRRRRRDPLRPGAGDLPRPVPGPRRGDLAARDRLRRGVVGAWRQHGYGNVRVRDGLVLGALSPLGVAAGVVVSNAVSERTLELCFAALALVIAAQLVRRALRRPIS